MFKKLGSKNKGVCFSAEAAALVGVSCGVCAMFHENSNAMFYSGLATVVGAALGGATSVWDSGSDAVKSMMRKTFIGAALTFGLSQAVINTHPHKNIIFKDPAAKELVL